MMETTDWRFDALLSAMLTRREPVAETRDVEDQTSN